MVKNTLTLGFIFSFILVIIQMLAGFNNLTNSTTEFEIHIFKVLDAGIVSLLNISVLIVLWIVLIKIYKQSQLNIILILLISLSMTIAVITVLTIIPSGKTLVIVASIAAIISVIIYFILINQIVEIDKSEIPQIEYLKNYCMAFVVSVFGIFIISVMNAFSRGNHLIFLIHFLNALPFAFLGIFFFKTKNE